MSLKAVRWEGSRGFAPTIRLAEAILARPASTLTPEEELVGRTMGGLLESARPIVCPGEQLDAISDDVFADLGEAFEYAMAARLPFAVTFFDFTGPDGNAPDMGLYLVEGGGRDLGFELRGVLAGEDPEAGSTVFLPIIGARRQPPEELGVAFVDWEPNRPATAESSRWRESIPGIAGGGREVMLMSVSAAMEALSEAPRAVPGALLGCIRAEQVDSGDALRVVLATATAVAVRSALKVLYLLDSVNVDVVQAPVSRQVRRQAERAGGEIAWIISVRPPRRQESEDSGASREFSHRFEVRGNFAHHREGSWLYEHSPPEDIRACPRCGRCRRVWRAPHVKGPADRPLAVKIRRVEFRDEAAE